MQSHATEAEDADPRLRVLDLLLGSPHGDLVTTGALHEELAAADPSFYAHLAAWYQQHGVVRDQQQLFIAQLALSPRAADRQAAFVLLQSLRTYQLARVVRYLKEVRHRLPRHLRSAVRYWLHRREAWPDWFDEVALRDRRNLKYLYATLHVAPSPRARAILFERRPPSDSRMAVLREIARHGGGARAAALIVEQRINFATAVGALRVLDAAVLAALIDVMTPQQLLNHLAALKHRGALEHPELRALVERKLEQAQTERRVHDARSLKAAEFGDATLRTTLERLASDRLRARGRIRRPTALFVDKSGSMDAALDVGRHLAALCSTITDADLWVYAFDSIGREVSRPTCPDLGGWSAAFAELSANGNTSIGAPFACLRRGRRRVEQIVVITDGEENTCPYFATELERYMLDFGVCTFVVIVHVGRRGRSGSPLEHSLRNARAAFTALRFDGDLYSLPNLVPQLTLPRRDELCAEILATPVPDLHQLEQLPAGFDPLTRELL